MARTKRPARKNDNSISANNGVLVSKVAKMRCKLPSRTFACAAASASGCPSRVDSEGDVCQPCIANASMVMKLQAASQEKKMLLRLCEDTKRRVEDESDAEDGKNDRYFACVVCAKICRSGDMLPTADGDVCRGCAANM